MVDVSDFLHGVSTGSTQFMIRRRGTGNGYGYKVIERRYVWVESGPLLRYISIFSNRILPAWMVKLRMQLSVTLLHCPITT